VDTRSVAFRIKNNDVAKQNYRVLKMETNLGTTTSFFAMTEGKGLPLSMP
jgi:hypothetical protein